MNPHQRWCHNRRCRAYGRPGEGHVVIHSQKERPYQCKRCGRTFTETKDTAFYRMHKPKWLVVAVLTLLSYGCPLQAIVAAFDLDERTVARWQRESGAQCRRVHEHLVEAGKVALLQVQADEIRVKAVGGIYWLASAMEVRSRLWLGSVISQNRDGQLIGGLLLRVRRCGPMEKILLVTDGLSSYKSQALKLFRKPLHNGEVGRPRLVLAAGVMIARVIKRRRSRRVVEVARRVLVGREAEVISRLIATQSSILALVNTAYIERLQATFRACLAPLGRRTRAGAHRRGTLEAGMWLVGGVATTWCGGIALSARNAPRPWRRGSPFQKLVAGGVAGLRGAAFGDTQMAREEAEVAAGGRACSLTTVQCGATGVCPLG